MKNLENHVARYLDFCEHQRALNEKTISAYRADLRQLCEFLDENGADIDRKSSSAFVAVLNQQFQPRTVKRKIAAVRAFYRWLEDEGLLREDPFRRLRLRLREPKTLPRTVPLRVIEDMLRHAYTAMEEGVTPYEKKAARRDAAVLELLFATGIRVSELCGLNTEDVDLRAGNVMIWGKGAKERLLQIGNPQVISALRNYAKLEKRSMGEPFFTNWSHERMSDQAVRRILNRYGQLADPTLHITPHMFRHSFATLLLEADVDIRYIQKMLGHTSILTTQIYTSVSAVKQREILTDRHPRNLILAPCAAPEILDRRR